ncbi:mCG1026670, partial [Mus musculus]
VNSLPGKATENQECFSYCSLCSPYEIMKYLCKLLESPWPRSRLKCRRGGSQTQLVKIHHDGEQLPYKLPDADMPKNGEDFLCS